MRKSFKALLLALGLTVVCVGSVAVAACGKSDGGTDGKGSGHVADSNPLGGEGLLDDGGEINTSKDVFVFTGVEYEGEHQIVLGQDSSKYTLTGLGLGTWSNSGNSFYRAQSTGIDRYITFEFDFSEVEDKTKVGCKVNLIISRGSILLSVSRDNEHWIDIGYKTTMGLTSDYYEHIDEIRGTTVSDENLYSAYYALGGYLAGGDTLYLRCGYTYDYFKGTDNANNGIGADIIDHVSYYDSLHFKGGNL